MKTTWLRPLKHLGTAASVLLLAAACTGESGSEGNLKFQDKSGVSSNQVLPVAQGRTVNYTITNTAFSPKKKDVDEAESSDESVFTVKNTDGSTVTIEGVGEGQATLTVITTEGVRDLLDLEVRTPQTTYYSISGLDEGAVDQGLIDVTGSYNLQVGDALALEYPKLVDVDGDRLSGETDEEFQTGTEGTLEVSTLSFEAGADGDALSVDNAYGSQLSVRTVDGYTPSTLKGYVHPLALGDFDAPVLRIQAGKDFSLNDGGYVVRANAVDADGYTYIGATDLQANVKVSAPGILRLTYAGRDDENVGDFCVNRSDDDQCLEWNNLPEVALLVTQQDTDATSVELEITTDGVTETFTLNL